jgi:hypothetical protein
MAVICVTCGSRLRVVDQRLIGTIANCPKCGAMVEITAESIISPSSGKRSAAEAVAPAIAPGARTVPEAPMPPATPAPRARLSIGHETGIDSEAITQSSIASPHDLDDLGRSGPVASDLYGSGLDGGDLFQDQVSGGLLGAPLSPADPAQVWQSESSRQVSQLALVVTLGLFGLIAATVAFAQFARSWSRSADPMPVAQARELSDATLVDGIVTADDPSSSDQARSTSTSPANPPIDASAPAQPSGTADSDAAAEALTDASPEAADAGTIAGSTGEASPVDAAQQSEPSQLPSPIDPIAAQATAVPTSEPVDGSPAYGSPADGPPGLDNLPPGLRKFVPLLNLSTADNGPPQIFETPPTIDSVRLDAAAGEHVDEDAAAKRPPIDIAKAMGLRFAIDQGGVTLGELMLLVSQLTGVPVELELISLDVAGISTTTSLKSATGWMSVQQWLDQSLAAAGMMSEIADGRILVFATPQKILQSSGSALRLDDFGDSAAEVARWIRPIVGPLATSADEDADDPWTFVADQSLIQVPLNRADLVRTILTVESARMIRRLPGRLERWQTERWVGSWHSVVGGAAEGDAVERPAEAGSKRSINEAAITDWPIVVDGISGPPLDAPRSSAGLLRQLATDNRVAIVVAWRDAMRHQFYPADLAMPFNDNFPAGALLDELLGELGLQARDAGHAVWWIGSEASYDRYEVITWMKVPPGGGEAIARQLGEALGAEDISVLPVAWDDTTLLVRAPRFIARQLERFAQSAPQPSQETALAQPL